ncbi:hypothetical protein [uncultured Nocardioides sp.]|uniref:hypothetical protein n=1 Tax=uncultured Nocardioides sp. TaxID=198441 RepID=UPI0026218D20|nr:hypothetical protein [uncultured Nocardioides sp.]
MRGLSRAAALGVSGLLALPLAQGPALAAEGPAVDGPSAGQLRDLAATLDVGAAFAADERRKARRVDTVRDPRGDAERIGMARGPRPYTRLADLTGVRYKTPSRVAGDVRITTRWADLRDGRQRGVRRQTQVTFLMGKREGEAWYVEVSNADDRVRVHYIGNTRSESHRVRPEKVVVDRTFGPGGTTDLVLSSEWLDTRRVSMNTVSFAGDFRTFDATDLSRVLDVGPLR